MSSTPSQSQNARERKTDGGREVEREKSGSPAGSDSQLSTYELYQRYDVSFPENVKLSVIFTFNLVIRGCY